MTRAIIYARYSPRANARQCQSIDTQLDLCQTHCQRHGYVLDATFTDEAKSGKDSNRTGLNKAIRSLKRGMVLVTYSPSRLARSVHLSEWLYERIAKQGAFVEFAEDGRRLGATPTDVLTRQLLAAVDQFERTQTAKRTKDASLHHQANGFAMSKEPPYGKQLGPRVEHFGKLRTTLVDAPAEQAAIRDMIELREEGLSYRAIARRLNNHKVPARGEEWRHGIVKKILARSVKRSAPR